MDTKKSILITGCSSGIGLRAAQLLQERGYQVFATVRNPDHLPDLIKHGLENSLLLDVNDTSSMQQALAKICEQTNNTLYALFNNAGYVMAGAVEDLPRQALREQFETNVFGPMELIRLVLPIMRRQGYGRIIQNSSILGRLAMPYCGAYTASKHALEGFSDTLRQELRGTNIYISIIEPGAIESALRDKAKPHFQQIVDSENSVHKANYAMMEKYYNREERGAKVTLPADAVINKLIHALESNKPKTRYQVGWLAKVMVGLKTCLPDRSMDALTHLATKDQR